MPNNLSPQTRALFEARIMEKFREAALTMATGKTGSSEVLAAAKFLAEYHATITAAGQEN